MVYESGSFFLEGDFAVGADEDGDCPGSSGAPSWAVFINSKIGSDDDSVPSIPRWGRNPIQSVDESVCGPIARIDTGGSYINFKLPSIS